MTTKWQVPPDLFAGQTIAVLATGPSMTQELADSVQEHRRIVVNDAYLFAPDADLLFAHDLSWWVAHPDAHEFAGLNVSGQEGDIDALYLAMPDETIVVDANTTLQVRNSGLMAVRIAAMAGAQQILLCGFEPELEPEHYPGIDVGLRLIIAELLVQGVTVRMPHE